MKSKFTLRLESLTLFLPPLYALLILALIFYFKPFWGLMDDENNRVLGQKMLSGNFGEIWNTHFWNDLYGNGRFRAWYWPMIAFLYGFSGTNSLITYLLNASFVFAVLLVLAKALGRVLEELFPNTGIWNFGFFLLFSVAFPWTNHLFISPSLQEKLVLLWGGLLLLAQPKLNEIKSIFFWIVAWIFLLALAGNSKEQIVLFYPILLGFQFQLNKGKFSRSLLLLSLLVISLVVIYWVGTWGGYKGKYGIEGLHHTLEHSRSIWLFVGLALISLISSIFLYFRLRNLPQFFLAITFGLSLLGFLAVLAPWGLGHYLNTSALPFCFLCFVLAVRVILPKHFLNVAHFIVVLLLPGLSLLFTFLPAFSAYGDLRALLDSPQLKAVAKEPLFMPAEEGRESFIRFAKWKSNLDLKIAQGSEISESDALQAGGVWIVSPLRANNSIDFKKLEKNGLAESIFEGKMESGFQLYRIRKP